MDDSRLLPMRIQSIALLAFLVVQYALGMYANLYVSFPAPEKPGQVDHGQMWGFAFSQPLLAAHIVIGFLLLVGAAVFIIRAHRAKKNRLYWPAWLGLVAIFFAGFSGATFVPYQTNLWSYSMALWFIVALFSYGWGYLLLRDAPRR